MCFTVKNVLGCRAVQLGRWRDMMSGKEEFIEIFREKITRPGADALLDYLENKSDFFTAPASARYHGAYADTLLFVRFILDINLISEK